MFDGAEVNEAEVLAWISKELATNEVVSDLDLIANLSPQMRFCLILILYIANLM